MQVSSTARSCHTHNSRARASCHPLSRTLTITRFQPASQSDVASAHLRQSSITVDHGHDDPAIIPAPQEMQASVMLVPKEMATQRLMKQAASADSPLNSFLVKCRLAWNLFFPPGDAAGSTRQLSPKELGKQRLSMILVADRCGLSPNSLVEMKRSTLAALQDCMDLEDLQDAHLRFTMTRENGVTYSMAVPILRPDEVESDMAGDLTSTGSWDDEYDHEQHGSDSTADGQQGTHIPVVSHAEDHGSTATALWPGSAELSVSMEDSAGRQHVVTLPSPSPATAAVPATGALTSSRAGSRVGSRGTSPIEIPLEGTAVMTPDMLKELLVEELVHDVEELVEHMGPNVTAVDDQHGGLVISAAAADGSAEAQEAAVLAEQLEAAVAEVQHFGEGPAGLQTAAAAEKSEEQQETAGLP